MNTCESIDIYSILRMMNSMWWGLNAILTVLALSAYGIGMAEKRYYEKYIKYGTKH